MKHYILTFVFLLGNAESVVVSCLPIEKRAIVNAICPRAYMWSIVEIL